MKYAFIEQHRRQFHVQRMCQVLEVSVSGYYAWRKRPQSQRAQANQALRQQIRKVFEQSQQTYGSPRVQVELSAQGLACGRHRVARLMRLEGLQARPRRWRRATTQSDHLYPVAPNLLQRRFTAPQPNQVWLSDISYIPTREGWLYLAVVLDLFSRRVVGWAMLPELTTHLPLAALRMALRIRQPGPGLLHHSDRGVQYCSDAYQEVLQTHVCRVSMSGRGNCYDNAPMESFFSTLKTERVASRLYASRSQARSDLFAYIEGFYNRCRRHSALGYLSPEAYEQSFLKSVS
jgi:transposase InsO family protein